MRNREDGNDATTGDPSSCKFFSQVGSIKFAATVASAEFRDSFDAKFISTENGPFRPRTNVSFHIPHEYHAAWQKVKTKFTLNSSRAKRCARQSHRAGLCGAKTPTITRAILTNGKIPRYAHFSARVTESMKQRLVERKTAESKPPSTPSKRGTTSGPSAIIHSPKETEVPQTSANAYRATSTPPARRPPTATAHDRAVVR